MTSLDTPTRRFRLLVGVGALVLSPRWLSAQQSPAPEAMQGSAASFLIERSSFDGDDYVFVTMRNTDLQPRGAGTEVSVVLPRSYPVLFGMEIGPAVTLANRHAAIMLRGGIGFLFLGFAPEAYVGAGAMVRVVGSVGLRVDVGERFLLTDHTWRRGGMAALGITILTPRREHCSP